MFIYTIQDVIAWVILGVFLLGIIILYGMAAVTHLWEKLTGGQRDE